MSDVDPKAARKFIWSLTNKDPGGGRRLKTMIRTRAAEFNVWVLPHGAVAMTTENFHESFVCKANGDNYYSISQWEQLRLIGWEPGNMAATADDEDAAEREDDELGEVIDAVEFEGFDYAFRHWSSFKDVKDKRFHELRDAYVKAANELAAYCGIE